MRILITVLVLIFSLQSWTKADDIRDFEIEGIELGDSALQFFSKNQIIKNSRDDHYINNKYNVYGCFCSPECAVAFLKREPIDTSTLWERYSLLNNVYSNIFNYENNIKPERLLVLNIFKQLSFFFLSKKNI